MPHKMTSTRYSLVKGKRIVRFVHQRAPWTGICYALPIYMETIFQVPSLFWMWALEIKEEVIKHSMLYQLGSELNIKIQTVNSKRRKGKKKG
ncbi:hypothetical protein RIF29_27808 [Crotalaria pallida]|uniref:Uncharacterized protein n=1 Tax=Crotalaria pallida TaxID=3830 RepID=A0AAN9EUL9_CROPI